ncbi:MULTISPECIES: M30 family zinc metallopeptidase [Cupriavidus]|uniref:Lipoprotein n=3 Tax=Cupriavidus TaxID=106589 RepID=A0A375CRG0_9BURK|nr:MULTISPECIES: hypothetical protein [Cupriavidus]MCO4865946.1 hypothetical protein [Cupriavidus sp. WGlv3]MCO4893611.1 hypothetical protein [Cupriavidus sp. WGtm5]CAP64096.1 conserved hypothetical protein; putative exported protein [Cupriavidus taiwanensis LMG 19424]SOY75364.1 conserved hypothetical protein; putative exported protein [Cupriavidus taiwanensis]SOY75371.1 conserved hypothetical protein; putative exported protein [Cupriavidus taiwanensis]
MTYKQRVLHFFRSIAQAALISIMLASCGGDGDDPTASPDPQTMTTTTSAPVEKSCSNCRALDAHTNSGSGIGVWESVNSTSSAVEVPISISGLNGQDVTLVFTNQTGTPQVMPTIAVAARNYSFVAEQLRLDDSTEALKSRISNFNRDGWRVHAKEQSYAPRYSLSPSRLDNGSVKIWYLADDTTRSTTLVRKLMTADGTIVNFWVETTEIDPTKVSQAVLDTLAGDFVSPGNGYSIWGSLGGSLNRHLGLRFYKHLLTNVSSTDSMAVLESSVRDTAATSGFQQEFRHFAATSGALMKEPAPVGFGFPLREEDGFVLPEINTGAFLNDRSQFSMVPAELHPYANVPVVREHVKGMYSETVKIPPHSSLSVVIQ